MKPARRPTRVRRWVRRALVLLGVAFALVAAGALVLLGSLDRPWLKRRVQAVAVEQAGVELDYGATRLQLSGLSIDGLVVRSPEPARAEVPELLRAEHLELGWSRGSVLGGGPTLKRLAVRGLHLGVVIDEHGGTSLDGLGKPQTPQKQETPGPEKPAPAEPLSRLFASLLASAPPVERIELSEVAATVVRHQAGAPPDRWELEGLALEAQVTPARGGWRVDARLAEAPLALTRTTGDPLARGSGGAARLRLSVDAALTPTGAQATIDLGVLEQSLVPERGVKHALALAVAARFDPEHGRTEVTVKKLEAADGAATAEAAVTLPDQAGQPIVLTHAAGRIDLERVTELVPPGLLPLSVRKARASYRVEQLELAGLPRLGPTGRVEAEGELAGLKVPLDGDGPEAKGARLEASDGRFRLAAHPAKGGGMAVRARVPLGLTTVALGATHASGRGLEVTLDGTLAPDGAFTGAAGLGFGALEVSGPAALSARDGKLGLSAHGFALDAAQPIASRGGLEVSLQAAALALAQPHARLAADGVAATVKARLSGKPPYAVELELPVERLRLFGARDRPLADAKVLLKARLGELLPELAAPLRTRGKLEATLDAGALTATLTANKRADALDWQLGLEAATLQPLVAFLPPPGKLGWRVPWAKLGAHVASRGKVEHLWSAMPRLEHESELGLTHVALDQGERSLAADRLALTLVSRGTARAHSGEADLTLAGFVLDGKPVGMERLHAELSGDLAAPSAHVALATTGGGPSAHLDLGASFDRKTRAVRLALDAGVEKLALLQPLFDATPGLDGFDVTSLSVGLKSQLEARGLVEGIGPDGTPRLSPRPLETLAVDGKIALSTAGLDWYAGDEELQIPRLTWNIDLAAPGKQRKLHGQLALDEVHLAVGDRQIDLAGIDDVLDATIDADLRAGLGEVTHRLAVKRVRQELVPAYPLSDLELTLRARRDSDGVLHLDEVSLNNGGAATRLRLHGGIDLGDERRTLSLKGELEQDLARLWTDTHQLEAAGQARLQVLLESPNLRVYRARGELKLSGGQVRLPRANVALRAIEGEVPVAGDFIVDKKGLRVLRNANVNTWSELRFADQQPLLAKRSFLSVQRIETPLAVIEPLAGNLQIDHNVVSLSQLELGLRGGRVTGQCVLDWGQADTTVSMHVRASRVGASEGDPFDGNAAVELSVRNLSLDGRAEILRIGRQHLLSLLDLSDPHRTDASTNRIRRALSLGYPDRVRLSFSHGFAALKVTLGGLAQLIRIDELRGIPIGPILAKVLAPLRKESP